jgi:hypothetical protein
MTKMMRRKIILKNYDGEDYDDSNTDNDETDDKKNNDGDNVMMMMKIMKGMILAKLAIVLEEFGYLNMDTWGIY